MSNALRKNQRRRKILASYDRVTAKRGRTITIMSIIVTSMFVVFTAPYAIRYMMYKLVVDPSGELARIPHHVKVALNGNTIMMWMAGPALNSYIVILTARRFRHDLRVMAGAVRGTKRLAADAMRTKPSVSAAYSRTPV